MQASHLKMWNEQVDCDGLEDSLFINIRQMIARGPQKIVGFLTGD
jgi:hypothetical protein